MARTLISLDDELHRAAVRAARRMGISLAELVRRGLREVLSQQEQRPPAWMRHAGTVCSGDSRASETVDDVVYGRDEP